MESSSVEPRRLIGNNTNPPGGGLNGTSRRNLAPRRCGDRSHQPIKSGQKGDSIPKVNSEYSAARLRVKTFQAVRLVSRLLHAKRQCALDAALADK